jgi:small-conductance mechanosensitive channel
VLPSPAPAVLLRDLGAGAYTFELACVVPDALHRAEVASDLRIAIDAALRARGDGPAPAAEPAAGTPRAGV